jgi:hypothetical protein
MDEQARSDIFHAQCENVRALSMVWRQINSNVNRHYMKDQAVLAERETRLLAIVYCALAESIFSKLINTPRGLSLQEIAQVKSVQVDRGVKEGWLKCVELALTRVDAQRSNHLPNARQRLTRLINSYIFDPSLIRNKLAHGQWCIALNRGSTAINADLTSEIQSLDVVELYRRRTALDSLSAILEDIIESPNKAHMRDYWPRLVAFESTAAVQSAWTLAAKVAALKQKASRRPAT